MINPDNKCGTLAFIIFIAGFLLATRSFSGVSAQSLNDPWSDPVNLSQSGAADNPVMVVDANEVIHVFWQDEFDGPIYTRGEGGEWSSPVRVEVPFGLYTPRLVADSSGDLHALWTDENKVLYYGRVNADSVQNSDWDSVGAIASSAVTIDVEVDEQDRLHLAYLRAADTAEAPTGVYYRRSGSGGGNWSNARLLYSSPYFRSAAPGDAQLDVDIAHVGDESFVIVAWDNRARGKIFYTRSSDEGLEWAEPEEVDNPEQSNGSIPAGINVYAEGEKILLLWQTSYLGSSCVQYYQWSLDGGDTWQPRQRMSANFLGCSQNTRIMSGPSGPILLVDSFQKYLQAWDGNQWSDPQNQTLLNSFINPETQQLVNLGCQQAELRDVNLYVLGCDAGEGGDIWLLHRSIDDLEEWFPQESVWKPLTSITRSQNHFLSLALAPDLDGRVHVFWTRTNNPGLLNPESIIYYSRWESERLWSQPAAILELPEEPVDQPAVALLPSGRLLLAWRRGEGGEIDYSYSDANQAALPSGWSSPQRLSSANQSASSPSITVGSDGNVYTVYAVPINEERGIYLARSADGGQSWSDPIKVFDGIAFGWEMVDQPRLATTSDNDLYLLWTRYALRSGQPVPIALAYVHSEDGGQTWSQPEVAVDSLVVWSAIVSAGEGTVDRFWQELTAGRTTTLWHERSLDNGQTWNRIAPISIFGESAGHPNIIVDNSGNLHLLQITSPNEGGFLLQHWVWNGERWGGEPSFDIDLDDDIRVLDMAAVVSPQQDLAVVFSARRQSQELGPQGDELFFTKRSLEPVEGAPTPLPLVPVTTEVRVTPTVEPTPAPSPTPTPDLVALSTNGGRPGNSYQGLLVGAILAGAIVTVAFGMGVWKLKFRR